MQRRQRTAAVPFLYLRFAFPVSLLSRTWIFPPLPVLLAIFLETEIGHHVKTAVQISQIINVATTAASDDGAQG
jgi:hypothetical protein